MPCFGSTPAQHGTLLARNMFDSRVPCAFTGVSTVPCFHWAMQPILFTFVFYILKNNYIYYMGYNQFDSLRVFICFKQCLTKLSVTTNWNTLNIIAWKKMNKEGCMFCLLWVDSKFNLKNYVVLIKIISMDYFPLLQLNFFLMHFSFCLQQGFLKAKQY